jgi:hypothetical protein
MSLAGAKCAAAVSTFDSINHLLTSVRGTFDAIHHVGRTWITMFRRDGQWQRADVELAQRCYEVDDLVPLLHGARLTSVVAHPAAEVGMDGDIGVGRVFIAARTPWHHQPPGACRAPE